jgi:hypothetical protein
MQRDIECFDRLANLQAIALPSALLGCPRAMQRMRLSLSLLYEQF